MKRILFSFLLSFAFISAFAQIPVGYYDGTTGLTGAALKSKLKQIITNGHQDHGYNGLWTGYQTTDRDTFYENDNTILDIYSENPTGTDPYNFTYGTNQCGSYNSEGDCYNREHIVPQSLFNEGFPMKSDINFIRPTDGKVNGMRSNYPFGKVGSASYTSLNGSKLGNSVSPGYSGIVFEPIDAFKGDVARMILYFVTRYETQLSGFSSGDMLGGSAFPGLQTWELNQLLAWNTADPVSPVEITRNNASYNYQGNRNPFIDNPAFVDQIWGTPTVDTQAPTAATNLAASNPTSNSISLSWTAGTDNVAVTGYDIYVNGVFYATVSGTTTVVSGLNPSSTYSFYIITKDAAGNSAPQSNTTTGTTLAGQAGGGSCGTENFENIPPSASGYATQTWTNNSITWIATDARTDQTITNKAIAIRHGSLTSSTISGGIQSLTVKTQLKFTGTDDTFNLEVNGVVVGTIPYSATVATTTINNINVSGNVVITLTNNSTSNRVAIDDLSWTCFSTLGTAETTKDKTSFTVYPNPVKNNELFVKGENLNKVSKATIYDLSGKLIETIANPFKNSNKINLKGLTKGNYILKTDNNSAKFIVE
ncbi:Por secretion system C-terminal sorting domain-containing protein [Chryseobacterium soldanellicola]|uniref:Por secretion system C-terminal sorting domain-containing protein n=1 Tax=Chryseobacterium soldanellicola TaxID=311333 RepID=A0A1H0YS72_9FLAO|nr:endonuclease [Chryseobacterium soldanellicola]SDQ18024.1 Por secretion system C-terminal sorting domain-containing protein [Chryseobacterium soldanellicola]